MNIKKTIFVAAALVVVSATASQASLITGFEFSGNGSISGIASGDFLNFTLTGGDSGLRQFTSTQWVGTAQQAGPFSFSWSYISSDSEPLAEYDPAGYILNGSKFQLPLDTQAAASGSVTVQLAQGDVFGWYVDSLDNRNGPGLLSITANNSAVAAVPEPSSFLLGALPALLGLCALSSRRAARKAGF
jgi:hypothetical protein